MIPYERRRQERERERERERENKKEEKLGYWRMARKMTVTKIMSRSPPAPENTLMIIVR